MKRSLTDTLLIGGACLFASWTAYCYVLLGLDASFADLTAWSFLPGVSALILIALCLEKPEPSATAQPGPPSRDVQAPASEGWLAWALGAITLGTLLLDAMALPYWVVWTSLLFAVGLVFRGVGAQGTGRPAQPVTVSPSQQAACLALVAVGAILVAITHRSSIDDALYLNFAVSALDFPDLPLLSFSGLWPGQNVPIEQPLYRLHTYELLPALLSGVFGADHKMFYYLVLAPLFGAAAVLVHWRLAEYLVPRHVLPFLLVWLVLILALGESHRAFGNFAFVRMFQGKGPLVTVALPLCLLLGLRFAEMPNWRRALALSAGVIASLGLSSSALATAPLVVAAALAGGLMNASWQSVVRIGVGAAVSLAVVLGVGVALFLRMEGWRGWGPDVLPLSTQNGLHTVLGGLWLGSLVLALFPLAPLFVGDDRRRRMFAASTAFFVIVVMNPWTAPFLASSLDKALEWRVFWSVPFVLSAAIVLTGLSALIAGRFTGGKVAWVVPIVLASIVLVTGRTSLSPSNNVTIKFPGYKVDPREHALASEIVQRTPERPVVYAPVKVAAWIPTFRDHPYPVVVRLRYLRLRDIREHVELDELFRRERLVNFIEGKVRPRRAQVYFLEQLAQDRPVIVVYNRNVRTADAMSRALKRTGYIAEARGDYLLWERATPALTPEAGEAAP